jgi:hypothetical protein
MAWHTTLAGSKEQVPACCTVGPYCNNSVIVIMIITWKLRGTCACMHHH